MIHPIIFPLESWRNWGPGRQSVLNKIEVSGSNVNFISISKNYAVIPNKMLIQDGAGRAGFWLVLSSGTLVTSRFCGVDYKFYNIMICLYASVFSMDRILRNTRYVFQMVRKLALIDSCVYSWFFLFISFSNAFPFPPLIAYTVQEKSDISHWESPFIQSGARSKGKQTLGLDRSQNIEVNMKLQGGSSLLFKIFLYIIKCYD